MLLIVVSESGLFFKHTDSLIMAVALRPRVRSVGQQSGTTVGTLLTFTDHAAHVFMMVADVLMPYTCNRHDISDDADLAMIYNHFIRRADRLKTIKQAFEVRERSEARQPSSAKYQCHYDVTQWKRFPRHRPSVGESICHRWIPSERVGDAEFDVSLILAWTNSWINRQVACEFRRDDANCDVIVMFSALWLRGRKKCHLQIWQGFTYWRRIGRGG